MAMDTQYFAGFNLEKMSLDETASWSDESKTFNLKDVGLDLKVGVILEKNHRLSLSHAEFSKDFIDLTLISGAYDYLIPINNDFKLYTDYMLVIQRLNSDKMIISQDYFMELK